MSRIRSIKPDTFDDPDLCDLPPIARWLFVGLWTQADREGRLVDDPRRLKNRLLPQDDVDVDALLDSLCHGFITRYVADGCNYIQINNFKKHQHVHPKEADSVIPAPAEESKRKPCNATASPEKPEPASVLMDPCLLVPDSGSLDKEIDHPADDLARRSVSAQSPRKTNSAPEPDGFAAFWSVYPRKIAKQNAIRAWNTARPDAALVVAILTAVRRDIDRWDDPTHIPHPATWLNGRRWEDEPDAPDVIAAREWLSRYATLYARIRQVPYVQQNQDLSVVRKLLSSFDADELFGVSERFIASDSPKLAYYPQRLAYQLDRFASDIAGQLRDEAARKRSAAEANEDGYGRGQEADG